MLNWNSVIILSMTPHSVLRCAAAITRLVDRVRCETARLQEDGDGGSLVVAVAELRGSLPVLNACASQLHPLQAAARDALAYHALYTRRLGDAVEDASEAVRLLKLR
jgi:hypothetical protein